MLSAPDYLKLDKSSMALLSSLIVGMESNSSMFALSKAPGDMGITRVGF